MAVVELQPTSGSANWLLSKVGLASSSTAWLVHYGLALTAVYDPGHLVLRRASR